MKARELFTFEDALKATAPVRFQTLVKPAGSLCNLDCAYCYYLDKALQYGGREPKMSDEVLACYIRQYIEDNRGDVVQFCWHGGEPLVMGLDFFRRAVELQRIYACGRRIENTLQTNGTLLDERWCAFFREHDFLIGISIDGLKEIHDGFRRTKNGEATWDRVVRGVRMLQQFGVDFNTLSTVNRLSEGRGAEVYRYLRDELACRYMQFLPVVEHVVGKAGDRPRIVPPEYEGAHLAPWSVSGAGYGQFLCDVFDEWIVRDVGEVFVQMFDATLARWCSMEPGVCSMCETCGQNLVVEHNGDVYPCDHFVYPQYRLGNIMQDRLADLFRSKAQRDFALTKRNALPEECIACRYRFACSGECPKHRFERSGDGFLKNSLCEGLYHWFSHAEPCMDRMRELLLKGRAPSEVMTFARERLNRG